MLQRIPDSMFCRIKSDVNGNPRYVCHYSNLLSHAESMSMPLREQYPEALFRARKLGGKKFHNKQYGGGIVFSTYNLPELEEDINKLNRPLLQDGGWPIDTDGEESE